MIKTTAMLINDLKAYANPNTKLSRMVKAGEYIPIVRGLYETRRDTNGYLLAGSIYGPSYLSFEFALAYYGMIPEAVYTFTSAAFDKKKKKIFETPFGRFTYRDVPKEAYPFGIKLISENTYTFQIATPEKALCDKLYEISPVCNMEELRQLLLNDLRINEKEFKKLNLQDLQLLGEKYHSTNINMLIKFVRKGGKL